MLISAAGFPLKACGNDRIGFLRFTHNFVVKRDTYDASYLIAGVIVTELL